MFAILFTKTILEKYIVFSSSFIYKGEKFKKAIQMPNVSIWYGQNNLINQHISHC